MQFGDVTRKSFGHLAHFKWNDPGVKFGQRKHTTAWRRLRKSQSLKENSENLRGGGRGEFF